MRFQLQQHIDAPVDDVVAAFVDPGFYESLEALPNLAQPELLSREEKGTMVRMRVRYRFTGHLSSAVKAAIDPKRLTWVEEADHDLAGRRVSFRMIADHYADRFKSSGAYQFSAFGDTTSRDCTGDVTIRMPLVGHRVENAIISGLREHVESEAELVERWIAGHDG